MASVIWTWPMGVPAVPDLPSVLLAPRDPRAEPCIGDRWHLRGAGWLEVVGFNNGVVYRWAGGRPRPAVGFEEFARLVRDARLVVDGEERR